MQRASSTTPATIQIRRVYAPPLAAEGRRYLVDRLWLRGCRREALQLDGWHKELASSNELRHWFNHDSEMWSEFQQRYFAELDANPAAWQPLLEAARSGLVTLLYGAHDEVHNNAAALKIYLTGKLSGE